MKHVFLRSGNTFSLADPDSLNVCDVMPTGTYTVGVTPHGAFFLSKVDDFELPTVVYGNADKNAQRILTTFNDRAGATGILLTGEKGSGKTMLAKRISQMAAEQNIITLIINTPFCGEGFNTFLQSIEQPAVVLFDEFEKVYDKEDQTKLLTVFDGTYTSKKLFILTCNDRWQVNDYMQNRPGRLYYCIEFGGIDADFIKDYCDKNLINKANINGIINCSAFFANFNFDMLKALVEEMNRYGETATEAMKILNIKPASDNGLYEITVLRDGRPVVAARTHGDQMRGSPLMRSGHEIYLYPRDEDDDEIDSIADPCEVKEIEIYEVDVSKLIALKQDGVFIFDTDTPGTTLHVKRKPEGRFNSFDYDAY